MKSRKSVLFLICVFILACIVHTQVTARRLIITVVDTENNPIEKVKISVTSPERSSFKKKLTTNKKGESAFVLPMQIKNVDFKLEKEGYQPHQQQIELRSIRSSQASFRYQQTFTLYRSDQLSPGQKVQMKEEYEKALPFFRQGIEFFQTGQYAEAAAEFEKALEQRPGFTEAWENLAAAYFRDEKYDQAIQAAEKVLETNPDSYKALKILSIAYSSKGDEQTAAEYLEKMKALTDVQFSAEELYNMAVTAANKGNDLEARDYFEKALAAKPGFALGHYQLGMCYFRLQEKEGAEKELQKYLELEPEGQYAEVARSVLEHLANR